MIRCIKYELHKLLIANKGWILVLLLLIMQLITAFNNNYVKVNKRSYVPENILNEYYSKWEGRLDEDKIKEINEEYEYISNIDNKIIAIEEKIENGLINEEDVKSELKQMNIKSKYKKSLDIFWEQYIYVCGDISTRELYDIRGWDSIYCVYGGLDFVLIIFVLCISAMIFS